MPTLLTSQVFPEFFRNLLDVLAGNEEGVAEKHCPDAQPERKRNPRHQIHLPGLLRAFCLESKPQELCRPRTPDKPWQFADGPEGAWRFALLMVFTLKWPRASFGVSPSSVAAPHRVVIIRTIITEKIAQACFNCPASSRTSGAEPSGRASSRRFRGNSSMPSDSRTGTSREINDVFNTKCPGCRFVEMQMPKLKSCTMTPHFVSKSGFAARVQQE